MPMIPCERCGTSSYDGSSGLEPVKCPFCRKFKKRGSREELIQVLKRGQMALAMAAGFIDGKSIATKEGVLQQIRDSFREMEDC